MLRQPGAARLPMGAGNLVEFSDDRRRTGPSEHPNPSFEVVRETCRQLCPAGAGQGLPPGWPVLRVF